MARKPKSLGARYGAAGLELPTAKLPDHHVDDEILWGYCAGQWPGYPHQMPPDCPVIGLGQDNQNYYYLDAVRNFVAVDKFALSRRHVRALFQACPNYLKHHWPRRSAKGDKPVNGLDVETALDWAGYQITKRIDPAEIIRGRGMWRLENGSVLWHAGEALFALDAGKLKIWLPGELEGHAYTAGARILMPWHEPVDEASSPVPRLLNTISSWQWENPKLDPVLIIGWIGCAFLGAALNWRPTLFMVGDKHTGKSTLQDLLRSLFKNGLVKAANASAAGIYQHLQQDVLPVMVDELEAKASDDKAAAIIDLARISASGDDMLRGSADHVGVRFVMRSVFGFSAINPPPMQPADLERMLFVRLLPLPQMKRAGAIGHKEEDGSKLLRMIMERFSQFDALEQGWADALESVDCADRGTYTTTLAMAALLIGEEGMDARGLSLSDASAAATLVAEAIDPDRISIGNNWSDCLLQVLRTQIDTGRPGERISVGAALKEYAEEARRELIPNAEVLKNRLKHVGLGFKVKEGRLAIPVSGTKQLDEVFAYSKWRNGGHRHALMQAPSDVVTRPASRGGGTHNVEIDGTNTRCFLINMQAFEEART